MIWQTLLDRLRGFVRSLFRRSPVALPVPVAPPRKRTRKSDIESQAFYFREDILDRLDEYAMYIEKMREDGDAYEHYKRAGAYLVANTAEMETSRVSPWFNKVRPSFAAAAWLCEDETDEEDEWIGVKFCWLTKYQLGKIPAGVEHRNYGDPYILTLWYATKDDAFKRFIEIPVVLDDEGGINPLRTRYCERQEVRHRRGNGETDHWRDHRSHTIKHERWGLPPELRTIRNAPKLPLPELAKRMFAMCANSVEAAASGGIQVVARKNNIHTRFTIDMLRAPYFFRDRDVVTNANGRKKRIFHIVRTHQRSDGSYVKTHFRGLREFDWNGYRVSVSVPGLHHLSFAEFNVGMFDGATNESPQAVTIEKFSDGIRAAELTDGYDKGADEFLRVTKP